MPVRTPAGATAELLLVLEVCCSAWATVAPPLFCSTAVRAGPPLFVLAPLLVLEVCCSAWTTVAPPLFCYTAVRAWTTVGLPLLLHCSSLIPPLLLHHCSAPTGARAGAVAPNAVVASGIAVGLGRLAAPIAAAASGIDIASLLLLQADLLLLLELLLLQV